LGPAKGGHGRFNPTSVEEVKPNEGGEGKHVFTKRGTWAEDKCFPKRKRGKARLAKKNQTAPAGPAPNKKKQKKSKKISGPVGSYEKAFGGNDQNFCFPNEERHWVRWETWISRDILQKKPRGRIALSLGPAREVRVKVETRFWAVRVSGENHVNSSGGIAEGE